MARQPRVSSSDNDSLKENKTAAPSSQTRVKMEKVNKAQAATRNKKRVQDSDGEDADEGDRTQQQQYDKDHDAEGDEDEEEADEEADGEGGSPKGRKRVRINSDGNSRPAETETEVPRVVTQPRDTDGFIPGSIVRIQLRNFVTYDFVEFHPGPYLNMIIGPNGTGKSSIACAICLGLNWSPAILGRAQEIKSFVKMDAQDGHIEIELKGSKGKPNLVIRRYLKSTNNASTFTLNGKPITGADVTSKMAELNVQVGNLCSFLPQDKVSEFAAMSPQQLLRETQRAAGDKNLTQWHDTLITMKERNEAIEKEVERFNQRKQIEDEIATLEIFIPCQRYRELLERYTELKAEQRRLHDIVKKLKEKNKPAHDLLDEYKQKQKKHEHARDARKKQTQDKFGKLSKIWSEQEKMESASEDLEMELEQLAAKEKQRAEDIKSLEVAIQKMKAERDKPFEIQDHSELEQEAVMTSISEATEVYDGLTVEQRTLATRRARANQELDDLKQQVEDMARTRNPVYQRRENAEKRLKSLANVDTQKLDMLAKFNKDTYDAVLWLRANKHQFRMEIIEPAMLSLTVPDKKFQYAVETSLGATQMKIFVAQCREDYDKLNGLINDREALGRKARIAVWFRESSLESQLAPPPMDPQEMTQLGFDKYLIDCVQCPEPMKFFLKMDAQFHRTAVALNGPRINVGNAMAAVGRSGGANFIAGNTVHQVTRSRYGRQALSNQTSEARQPKYFGTATVDQEQKRELEKEIRDCEQDLTVINDEINKLQEPIKEAEEEISNMQAEVEKIKKRKEAIKAAITRRKKLDRDYETNVKKVNQLRNAPSLDIERQNIRQQISNIAKKRVKFVKECTDLARTIVVDQMETTKLGLQYLQICANKAYLERRVAEEDTKCKEAEDKWKAVDKEYLRAKDITKEALDFSRDTLSAAGPELVAKWEERQMAWRAYFEAKAEAESNGAEVPSAEGVDLRSADELEDELQRQQAKLELTNKSNPGVVEQFERRKRDIEILENTLNGRQQNASRVDANIKKTLGKWRPALEQLIASIGEKFSAAFDRIGCAGEIHIREHEEYEKWAIDILVKFRDEEKLQLLTGQRQSGGERSLTTILYLMSLTEEARAPFSLVDEINQGMDQRAERVVHNSLVDVTCKDEAAQYFLITPKLLPHLQYHKRMRILCVNNGEWLPEEKGLGNMMRMIEGYLNKQKGQSSRSN
ncbi:hypothetical protein D9758_014238 [Tetrapyrgos nigripes]|uniref:Structural maintenance of chromosomes protein 5 n=1 Tax=Tetrapyrgos nigripes TaxID=182062 RepID=A0A8H5CA41_9AGAR|nr:hypothetical protein D9758_014238 [Tetrapyrgos nigripes]